MKRHIFLFLLLLPLLLAACHPTGNSSQTSTAADTPSPRYLTDSLRTLGPAHQLCDENRERDATPYLDSVFLLPARLDPAAPPHPDSLTTREARQLCNRALRELMANYNILMDYEAGLRHLDSLQRLRLPFIERYCLRGLLTAKAQMLMPLDRHNEAIELLNRAMQLAEAEDSIARSSSGTDGKYFPESPEYDNYWSGAAGITYMGVDTVSTRAKEAFLRVIDIARRTGFRGGLYSHSVARLADIYLREGKYEQSIALCREAIDTTPDRADEQGRLVAAENLTEAYRQLGLYEDALRYCALVTDAPDDYQVLNNLRGYSYINRAAILGEMQRTDEALLALTRADSCFQVTDNDYCRMQIALERAHLLSTLPDSLAGSLRTFAAYESQVPPHFQASYHYYYGSALVRAGQYARAVPLLQQAVTQSENTSQRLMAHEAARLLVDCYLQLGQYDRLARFLPHYQALTDSVASDSKIRQLASANIRFETEKKEQQNRALTAEVALKDSRLHTTLLVGALCLLLLAAVIVWGVMRHRALSLRHRLNLQEKASAEKERQAAEALLHEKESQLHRLIESRQRLHDRNRALLRQLSDIQAAHPNTCDLEGFMESLQQSLFSKEDAEVFRRNFSAVYPMALTRLRTHCPDLTYSDELFCILAMLKQNNEEMAHTLGISKPSVSKMRYRIRLKLELPEGTDVDAEIKKIMEAH